MAGKVESVAASPRWSRERGVGVIGAEFFLHELRKDLARHPGAPPPVGRRWRIEPLEDDPFANSNFRQRHERGICWGSGLAMGFAVRSAIAPKGGWQRGEAEVGFHEVLEVATEIDFEVVGALARRAAQEGRETHAEGLVLFFWMNGFPHAGD